MLPRDAEDAANRLRDAVQEAHVLLHRDAIVWRVVAWTHGDGSPFPSAEARALADSVVHGMQPCEIMATPEQPRQSWRHRLADVLHRFAARIA